MRRGLAVATLVFLALGLALLSARGRVVRVLEARVARVLTDALPVPLQVESVAFELVPPRLTLRRPSISRNGRTAVSAQSVVVGLALGPSLWEGEWLVDVEVERPSADVDLSDAWWNELGGGGSGGSAASIRRLAVRDGMLSVRVPEHDVNASFAHVGVSVRAGGMVVATAAFVARAAATIERAGRRLAVEEIAVGGTIEGNRWRVDRARLAAGETILRANGTIAGDELGLSIGGAVDLPPIFALLPEAGVMSGKARVTADVSGRRDAPNVAADLEVENLRIDRIEISGRTSLRARGPDWEMGPAKLSIFGGALEASARGRLAPDVPYAVDGRMIGWDPSVFLAALDVDLPIRGTITGEGSLRGRLLAEEMAGDARFELSAEGRSARGESTFLVSPPRDVIDVTIRSDRGGVVRARDEIAAGRHRGEVTARGLDLAEVSPFVGVRLAGVAEIDGTIRDAEPILDGRGSVRALVFEDVPIGDVVGRLALSPSGVSSDSLEARDLGATVSGTASFEPDSIGDLRVTLAAASVERWAVAARHFWPWIPVATGQASGDARISGSRSSPLVRLEAKATEATLAGESLGTVEVSVDRTKAASAAKLRAVGSNGDEAKLDITVDSSRRLRGTVAVPRWSLGQVELLRRGGSDPRGVLRLDGTLDGTLDRPAATGTIRVDEASIGGFDVGSLTGELRVDDRKAIAELRASSEATATIDAAMEWPHRYRARATWTELTFVPELWRERRLEITGSGSADVSGDFTRPLEQGTVRLDRLRIGHPGGVLTNPRPWLVRIEDGAAALDDGALEGSGQRLVLAGRASVTGYRLSAQGEASLALAEGWVPGLVSSRGLVELDLIAEGGPGRRPLVRGGARIRDAAADLGVVVGLTDVAGALDFRDEEVTIRELRGAVGGGRFAVDGAVSQAGVLALRWQLWRASLGVPEWLDHRVSGEGTLAGPLAEPVVDGSLQIEQAIYDQNVEWGEFLPWFRRHTRLPPAQRAIPLRFDLRLVAADGIFVDNNLAKIELSANLHLRGDLARPTLDGRIAIREGTISFRGRVFELTAGELRFEEARPFDPAIDVRGESRVRTPDDEIEVGLHVSGTAESPRIELSSDEPSLTRNDLLALVTFGRTMSQLQTSGGAGVSLDELLSLTAGERGERLGSGVQRILPVDRIEIESAYSRTSGTTEPRVRIGKDLTPSVRSTPFGFAFGGPMRASVGSSLGTGRERDVTLDYGLTRSISIEGLWESQTESGAGAFGADVKFRVPFWQTPFSLLPAWLRPAGESAALP